jgi:hypothetical protein
MGKFQNLEMCFGICRKRSVMQRCVDGARDVTYCFCCTRMFIYADIIRADGTHRKRYFDRSLTMLEFMAAVWREHEDCHAT